MNESSPNELKLYLFAEEHAQRNAEYAPAPPPTPASAPVPGEDDVDAIFTALQQAHRSLSRERERARAQQEQARVVQKRYEELLSRGSQETQQLRVDLDGRSAQLDALRAQLESLKSALSHLENNAAQISHKFERANEELTVARAELSKREEQVRVLLANRNEILRKARAREEHIQKHYEAELAKAKVPAPPVDTTPYEDEIARLRSEREILRSALTQVAEEKAALEAQMLSN